MCCIEDCEVILEKFEGKGGWTFASIENIMQDPSAPFGWVTVSGYIDDIFLDHVKLMPMGDKKLFLPVKAGLRKTLKKQAGDLVRLRLKIDQSDLPLPDILEACFQNEDPALKERYLSWPVSTRKAVQQKIEEAKTEGARTNYIVNLMERLEEG